MTKNMLRKVLLLNSLVCLLFTTPVLANEKKSEKHSQTQQANYSLTLTPLSEQIQTQPTAKQLKQGELIVNFDTRLFFLPDLVPGGVDDGDTAANFNTGFVWGISDDLQLALQFQFIDSSSPAQQGNFISERTENQAAAGELKFRLWENGAKTQALSGVTSLSWGTRGFRFTGEGQEIEINNRNIFVALAIPYTADIGNRWEFTIAPTIGFFSDNTAGFFQRLPGEDEDFGTVFGLAGGFNYEISPRLFFWSDVFVPFTGNNSISRGSGDPARAIAYNGGIRYLINPRLGLDVFASNTFGSFGPISLTADRDLVAFGTNLRFLPDVFAANRKYRDRFKENSPTQDFPLTTDGLAFFDGGVVNGQDFIANLQVGSQGILSSLRYGLLKDLEVGIFLDSIFGETDESEQGYSAKIRLLNQAEDSPFTLSLAGTVSITNQPFLNFLNGDVDAFASTDFDQELPIFTPGGDDIEEGKQLIVTFAVPVQYQIAKNTAIWATPSLGFIQRSGVELAGFNLGGSLGFAQEFSVLAEVGANFAGEGNSLSDDGLENEIPWTAAIRWHPSSIFGLDFNPDQNPNLELYFTNRVGSSTWQQLRVREDNNLAVGVGIQVPF